MHKKLEKGYAVIFSLIAILVATIVIAFIFLAIDMNRRYELAKMAYDLSANNPYAQQVGYSIDLSVFNWAISAESAALALIIPFQFNKKARNNTDEYVQKWISSFLDKPEMAPYASSIITTYLQTNSNR